MELSQEILNYWFGDLSQDPLAKAKRSLWWQKKSETDDYLREHYGVHLERALGGEYDGWCDAPSSTLALVILLDQFSRNIHRDTPQAFAADAKCEAMVHAAMRKGYDKALAPVHRAFLYMPLMHSESLETQELCIRCYEALYEQAPPEHRKHFRANLDFAIRHRDIIARFGRYPHRNQILGRVSSAEEEAFLQQPGSSF